MRFKVGDKVRVRKDLDEDGEYPPVGANDGMAALAGTVQEVEKISNEGCTYRLVGNVWIWTDEMLEPADETPVNDPVDHPSHYTSGGIECIDAIEAAVGQHKDAVAGFLVGQVIKYVWRFPLKGKPAQDLKKARWYLDRLIARLEKEEAE